MAEYYLISQLPSLDATGEDTPLPVSEASFMELCSRFLKKRTLEELNSLSLVPSRENKKSASSLVNRFNDNERQLRLVLAQMRAEKMKKSFKTDTQSFPASLVQTARTALEFESPMEAEKFLNRYRIDFLEALRPSDSFSEEFIFYYALKLKLIQRMRNFDRQSGEAAYRKIYDSIMSEDKTEAIQ